MLASELMSARTGPSAEDGTSPQVRPEGPIAGLDARLGGALGLAVASSVLALLGSTLDVLHGAAPGYPAWPLLGVLSLLPTVLALEFARRRRPHVAIGVLAAGAVLASGRILLDSQFLVDPSRAARPEHYVAETLIAAGPGWGLWALLAGHLTALAAGVLALNSLTYADEPEGPARRSRQQALTASTLIGLGAGFALMLPGFGSDNAYVLAGSAVDGPELVVGGTLVLAGAIPLSAALSVTARSWQVTRGVFFGLAVGVVALVLPNLVSALALPWLHVASGPVVGLLAAAGLAGFAAWPVRVTSEATAASRTPAAETDVPDRRHLQLATGGLALVTAVFAVLGGRSPQVVSILDGSVIDAPAGWLLVVSGLLVAVPGAVMFSAAFATVVRPALSTLWAAVVMVGMSLVSTSVVASRIPGATDPGAGVWLTVVAVLCALLLGGTSLVAGIVDRDEEDTESPSDGVVDQRVRIGAIVAGVLAFGAFGMSTIEAPDFAGSGLWQGFGVPFWGQLAGLLAVLGGLALAPRCRPSRAAALLAGVSGVVLVRALELPIAGPLIPGATAGAGTWLALACLAVVGSGAALSAISHRESRPR